VRSAYRFLFGSIWPFMVLIIVFKTCNSQCPLHSSIQQAAKDHCSKLSDAEGLNNRWRITLSFHFPSSMMVRPKQAADRNSGQCARLKKSLLFHAKVTCFLNFLPLIFFCYTRSWYILFFGLWIQKFGEENIVSKYDDI
jgi:hypothetical protein